MGWGRHQDLQTGGGEKVDICRVGDACTDFCRSVLKMENLN